MDSSLTCTAALRREYYARTKNHFGFAGDESHRHGTLVSWYAHDHVAAQAYARGHLAFLRELRSIASSTLTRYTNTMRRLLDAFVEIGPDFRIHAFVEEIRKQWRGKTVIAVPIPAYRRDPRQYFYLRVPRVHRCKCSVCVRKPLVCEQWGVSNPPSAARRAEPWDAPCVATDDLRQMLAAELVPRDLANEIVAASFSADARFDASMKLARRRMCGLNMDDAKQLLRCVAEKLVAPDLSRVTLTGLPGFLLDAETSRVLAAHGRVTELRVQTPTFVPTAVVVREFARRSPLLRVFECSIRLPDVALMAVAHACPLLERVQVEGDGETTELGIAVFLQALRNVRVLDLCRVVPITTSVWTSLAALPCLRELGICVPMSDAATANAVFPGLLRFREYPLGQWSSAARARSEWIRFWTDDDFSTDHVARVYPAIQTIEFRRPHRRTPEFMRGLLQCACLQQITWNDDRRMDIDEIRRGRAIWGIVA